MTQLATAKASHFQTALMRREDVETGQLLGTQLTVLPRSNSLSEPLLGELDAFGTKLLGIKVHSVEQIASDKRAWTWGCY